MTTHKTGNPIGSTNPKDLYDNSRNMDEATNSLNKDYWDDRLGRKRLTWEGMTRLSNLGAAVSAAERAEAAADIAEHTADMRTYFTKAEADAALPMPSGTVIRVTNDPDANKNGYWVSDGEQLVWSGVQPVSRNDVSSLLMDKADKFNSPSEEIGGGMTSRSGDLTWLHFRKEDGGPTELVVRNFKARMGVPDEVAAALRVETDEIGGGMTSKSGDLTWLHYRTSDGGPTSAIINLLRERLGLGNPGNDYRVHPVDGAVVRGSANLSLFAIWGSSSAWYLAPLIASQVQGLYGATTYNGGVSGQGVESIGARLGSRAADLIFPANVVPASGTVEVTSTTDFYRFINYAGVVAGVHGRLQRSVAGDPLRFTRTVAGESVPLVGATPFIPDDGMAHRDSVTLLWMGKNDTSSTGDTAAIVQKVVSYIDEAFNWLAPANVRALVLGHFINYGSSAAARDQINQINAAHAKRYGPLFVDVQGWLMSPQVWIDLDITPTAQDLSDQADGVIAESLRRDNSHLTDAAYIGIFTFLIRPKLELELNWL